MCVELLVWTTELNYLFPEIWKTRSVLLATFCQLFIVGLAKNLMNRFRTLESEKPTSYKPSGVGSKVLYIWLCSIFVILFVFRPYSKYCLNDRIVFAEMFPWYFETYRLLILSYWEVGLQEEVLIVLFIAYTCFGWSLISANTDPTSSCIYGGCGHCC